MSGRPEAQQVVVITGAGGGMAEACIPRLAPAGRLVLVDLNEDCLDRAREAAREVGA